MQTSGAQEKSSEKNAVKMKEFIFFALSLHLGAKERGFLVETGIGSNPKEQSGKRSVCGKGLDLEMFILRI